VNAVTGGGSLVVLSRARLPAGPLRELVTGREATGGGSDAMGAGRGRLGLGRWWAMDGSYQNADATRFELPDGVVSLVAEAIEAGDHRPRADMGFVVTPSGATIAPARFTDALEVPGIGRVPVRTFFFTILGFALIAGPLSYVLLRRRKRLTAFLVLLPALGIVFSGAILLYGLLSEGTGIRGSVRSLTVLDQRAHEAVTRSGRTLYAAFSPGGLRLDPQTLLLSDDFERSTYGYRWGSGTQAFLRLQHTDGIQAEGSALPSRIPITYDVTTVAPARERLASARGPAATTRSASPPSSRPWPARARSSCTTSTAAGTWGGARAR
jgi:LPXTG-motif cell wall-anchored protein